MESEDVTGPGIINVGDLVRYPPYSWVGEDVLLVVKVEDDVGGEPLITVLVGGELLKFRPWKLRKVQ